MNDGETFALDDIYSLKPRISNHSCSRQALPWMVTAAREEFERPPKDRVNTSSSGSTLIRFRSPAAHRLQLRSTSCAIWFPEDDKGGFSESFSFMTSQAPTTPSLALALDASCLVQVGQEHHNERMLLEGRKMYCDALHFLRLELSRSPSKRSDALLATINVLQVIEANICMGGADWRNHSEGAMVVVQRTTKDSKRLQFGWSRLVEHQFLMFQFWEGLVSKRPLDGMLTDDAPAILLLAQQIPGLLKRCDEVCLGNGSEEQAFEIAHRLKDLDADLAHWTAQWNRCMRESRFQLVSADTFAFPAGQTSRDGKSCAFPQVFDFNELVDCVDHFVWCGSMLAIKHAMLDLAFAAQSSHVTPTLAACLPTPKALSSAGTACADGLCMGMPYSCELKHGKFGKVVTAAALSVALDWYAQLHDSTGSKIIMRKLRWCRDAAVAVENDGIRVPFHDRYRGD